LQYPLAAFVGGIAPSARGERDCKKDRQKKKNSGAANKIYLDVVILFFGFLAGLLKEHVLSFGFLVQSKRSHTDLKIHKHEPVAIFGNHSMFMNL
jgi:hypothetical protein